MRLCRWAIAISAALSMAGCSSKELPSHDKKSADKRDDRDEPEGDSDRDRDRDQDRPTRPPSDPSDAEPRCDEAARLVYVVSREANLYAFSPTIPGLGAYHLVGHLKCASFGEPQSMAVDRRGIAWVFYDTGELFKVSVRDASCNKTAYHHPSGNHQLGMGFTAVGAGLAGEQLYIASPDFGLATLNLDDFSVHQTRKLVMGAELTGGGDGRLFHFSAETQELSQVDLTRFSLVPLRRFDTLGEVSAWAISRYAGRFYMFTSPGEGVPSKTTEFDPTKQTERMRDSNLGFVVVGAGQSTCVPRNDGDTGIGGPAPNDPPSAPSAPPP
ncbi:MAG: hypothetical protein U0271_07570 [Polyangiaceae bacterium]